MKENKALQELVNLYHEHRLGHAFLIETNNIEECYRDILTIIKKIICPNEYYVGCTKCNLCHLIDINSLPSLITIAPDGKSIKKDAIENLKRAFINIPLYTKDNIYIIKEAEKMNDTAYNKMLKFVEEPEDNIIGFFLTKNKDDMPNTIVSRCELIKSYYNISASDYSDDIKSIVHTYAEKINGTTELIWYNNEVNAKLTEREDYVLFFKCLFDYYNTRQKDYKTIEYIKIINKYLDELNYNVNTSLLLDSFAIEMRNVYEK